MNKNKVSTSKGFTLIELLVVIAIIGILASLVLVALGSARTKANDARIKSDIAQLRTLAEVIYDNNSSKYELSSIGVVTCFTAPTDAACLSAATNTQVTALRADIVASGGTALSATNVKGNTTNYCLETTLASSTSQYFCTDATGSAKVKSAASCTAATSTC